MLENKNKSVNNQRKQSRRVGNTPKYNSFASCSGQTNFNLIGLDTDAHVGIHCFIMNSITHAFVNYMKST